MTDRWHRPESGGQLTKRTSYHGRLKKSSSTSDRPAVITSYRVQRRASKANRGLVSMPAGSAGTAGWLVTGTPIPARRAPARSAQIRASTLSVEPRRAGRAALAVLQRPGDFASDSHESDCAALYRHPQTGTSRRTQIRVGRRAKAAGCRHVPTGRALPTLLPVRGRQADLRAGEVPARRPRIGRPASPDYTVRNARQAPSESPDERIARFRILNPRSFHGRSSGLMSAYLPQLQHAAPYRGGGYRSLVAAAAVLWMTPGRQCTERRPGMASGVRAPSREIIGLCGVAVPRSSAASASAAGSLPPSAGSPVWAGDPG